MNPLLKLILEFVGLPAVAFALGVMYDYRVLNKDTLYQYIKRARKKKYPLIYLFDGKCYHLRHVVNCDDSLKPILKTDKGEWIYNPFGAFAPLVSHNVIIGFADYHRSIATPIDVVYAIEDLKSRGVSEHELASFLYDVAHCRDYEEFKKKTIQEFESKIEEVKQDEKMMEALRTQAKKIAKAKGLKEEQVLEQLVRGEARKRLSKPYSVNLFMLVKPELTKFVRTGINRLTICNEIELQRRAGELESKKRFGFDPMWLIYGAIALLIVFLALGMRHHSMLHVAQNAASTVIHKPVVIHPKPAGSHAVSHAAGQTTTAKATSQAGTSNQPKLKG